MPAVALPGNSALAVPGASAPWEPLGPDPQGVTNLQDTNRGAPPNSGRVTALVVTGSGPLAGRVVLGTASGGVWTSDDGGTTWTPRTDDAATLAIGSLAIDPSNPLHLIAGTGEANQSTDSSYGDGILSSSDGGTTWTLQNPDRVFVGSHIGSVAIDPSDGMHMFAATSGGLYETDDGGTTWAKPADSTYTPFDGEIDAVVIDPSDPQLVYIAGTTDGTDAFVAESADGGATWTSADSGLSTPPGASRVFVALALAPSNPQTLYASVGSRTQPVALERSTDGGGSWSTLTAAPDYTGDAYSFGGNASGEQGDYDNALAVDPTNPDHILAGGEGLVETTDGGATWSNVNGGPFNGPVNRIHTDQHALAFGPDGRVWIGNDGGVYVYTPSTNTIADLNGGGLNTIQFYEGFGEVDGTILAGTQDNATARTSSPSLAGWTRIASGDGGPSAITPNDPNVQFIEADDSLLVTSDAFASTKKTITPQVGGLVSRPPIAVIPNTRTPSEPTILFGADSVYASTDPITSGQPTWTAVASSALSGDVSAFAVSPSNPQIVYAGFDDGTIEVSTAAGAGGSWTALPFHAFGSAIYITGISVDPSDPQAITVSVSYAGTRTVPGLPHVGQFSYTNTPSDGSWTDISGDLPSAAVAHVVYDHGALLAATDVGVYATDSPAAGATSWTAFGSGLPDVQVQDLAVDPVTADVYAVTHGRGAWVLRPDPAAAVRVTVSPSTVTADGHSATTLTATVTDGTGHRLPGEAVTFTASDPADTIGPVADDEDGAYTAVLTVSTTPGPVTITATDNSQPPEVSGQTTLTQLKSGPTGPTGATGSTGSTGPTGPTGIRLAIASVKFKGPHTLSVVLQCLGSTPCTGQVYALTGKRLKLSARRFLAPGKKVTSARYAIDGGGTATVRMRLTSTLAQLVRRHRLRTVRIVFYPTHGGPVRAGSAPIIVR